MNLTLSCEQVRQLDADAVRELQIPSLLLMENAARGAADVVMHERHWKSVTIVCGPGNNGGDGLALARQLAAGHLESTVILVRGDRTLSEDARANLTMLELSGHSVHEIDLSFLKSHLSSLSEDDLLVDAVLGTGVRGTVRSPFQEVIRHINDSAAFVLSLDLPSGLDCDLGTPCGTAVKANRTVTFAAFKKGMQNEVAASFTGHVTVAHIGLPASWIKTWYERILSASKTPKV